MPDYNTSSNVLTADDIFSGGSPKSTISNVGSNAILNELRSPSSITEYMDTPQFSITPDILKRYDDPSMAFNGQNLLQLENTYANDQSNTEKWGNAMASGWGKFASTAVGNFDWAGELGLALGKENLIEAWGFKKSLIDWSDTKSAENPIYQTQYTNDHPFLSFVNITDLDSFMGTWAETFSNLGFTAGSVVNAVVTDIALAAATGVGEFGLMPKQIATIGKSLYNAFRIGKNTKRAAASVAQGAQAIALTRTTTDKLRSLAFLGNMAVGEGTIEGYHTYKTLKNDLLEGYMSKNGLLDEEEVPLSIKNDINQTALDAGQSSSLLNTALLMATNIPTAGLFMRGVASLESSAARSIGGRMFVGEGGKIGVNTFKSYSWKGFTNSLRFPTTGWGQLRNTIFAEGFEEGAQFSIEKGEHHYYKNKFLGTEEADNLLHSIGHGLSQTLGTNEGLRNIAMGMFTGPVVLGGGNISQRVRAKANGKEYQSRSEMMAEQQLIAEKMINEAESGVLSSPIAKYKSLSEQTFLATKLKEAIDKGDSFAVKGLLKDQLYSFATSAAKMNNIGLRLEQLEDLKGLEGEDFWNAWSLDSTSENKALVSNYVDQLKKDVEKMGKDYNTVRNAFGANPFNPKTEKHQHDEHQDMVDDFAFAQYTIGSQKENVASTIKKLHSAYPYLKNIPLEELSTPKGFKKVINSLKSKKQSIDKTLSLFEEVDKINKNSTESVATTTLEEMEAKTRLGTELKAEQKQLDSLLGKLVNFENVIEEIISAQETVKQAEHLLSRKNRPIQIFGRKNKKEDAATAKTYAEAAQVRIKNTLEKNNVNDENSNVIFNELFNYLTKGETKRIEGTPEQMAMEEDLSQSFKDIGRHLSKIEHSTELFNQLRTKRGVEAWKIQRNSFLDRFLYTAEQNNGVVGYVKSETEIVNDQLKEDLEQAARIKEEIAKIGSKEEAQEEFVKKHGEEALEDLSEAQAMDEEERTEEEQKIVDDYEEIEKSKTGLFNGDALSEEEVESVKSDELYNEEDSVTQKVESSKRGHYMGGVANLFGGLAEIFTTQYKNFLEKGGKALLGTRTEESDDLVNSYFNNSTLFSFVFGKQLKGYSVSKTTISSSQSGNAHIKAKMYRNLTNDERLVIKNNEGKVVATIPDPNSIYVEVNGELLPIGEALENDVLNPTNFLSLTGQSVGQFSQFKNAQRNYAKLYANLNSKLQNQESLSEEELETLFTFNVSVKFPEVYSKDESTSTLISDLTALGETSYIIKKEEGALTYYSNKGMVNTVPSKVTLQVKRLIGESSNGLILVTQRPGSKTYSAFHARPTDIQGVASAKSFNELSKVLTVPVRSTIYDSVRVSIVPASSTKTTSEKKSFVIQGLEVTEEAYSYTKAVGKNYSEIIKQLKKKNLITKEEDC